MTFGRDIGDVVDDDKLRFVYLDARGNFGKNEIIGVFKVEKILVDGDAFEAFVKLLVFALGGIAGEDFGVFEFKIEDESFFGCAFVFEFGQIDLREDIDPTGSGVGDLKAENGLAGTRVGKPNGNLVFAQQRTENLFGGLNLTTVGHGVGHGLRFENALGGVVAQITGYVLTEVVDVAGRVLGFAEQTEAGANDSAAHGLLFNDAAMGLDVGSETGFAGEFDDFVRRNCKLDEAGFLSARKCGGRFGAVTEQTGFGDGFGDGDEVCFSAGVDSDSR